MQAVLEALIASFSTSLNHLACFVSSKSACRAMATNISKPKTMTATIIRHLAWTSSAKDFSGNTIMDCRCKTWMSDTWFRIKEGIFPLLFSLYTDKSWIYKKKHYLCESNQALCNIYGENIAQVEHSRHRCFDNVLRHFLRFYVINVSSMNYNYL